MKTTKTFASQRVALGVLAAGAGLVVLTACGGGHASSTPAPPATHAAASAPATSASTGVRTASPAPAATPTGADGLPVLMPDAASPALKAYSKAVVTDALTTARRLAYASLVDATLLDPSHAHTDIRDYSAVTQYLTPAAEKTFASWVKAGNWGKVFTLALPANPDNPVRPDVPLRLGDATYTPNLNAGLAKPADAGDPGDLVVGGALTVYIHATKDGESGYVRLSRSFTFHIVATGSKAQPVQVASWYTSRDLGSTLVGD